MLATKDSDTLPDDDELNPAHRARRTDSPESLQDQEGGHDYNPDRAGQAEIDKEFAGITAASGMGQSGSDSLGAGYNAADVPGKSFGARARGFFTPKRMLIGGGILGFFIAFFMLLTGLGGFELVNLRENLLGRGNRFTNTILQHRRAKSFANMLKKMNNGTFEQNINKVEFKKSFERRGFTMEFDERGKLIEFGFTDSKGRYDKVKLDATGRAWDAEVTRFFGSSDFGREASRAYDQALSAKKALWRGPLSRQLYRLYGFVMRDWLDSRRQQGLEPDDRKMRLPDALRHADDPRPTASADPRLTADELGRENPRTNPDGSTSPSDVYSTSSDLVSENGMTPDSYRDALLSDPAAGTEVLGGAAGDSGSTAAFGSATSEMGDKVASALDSGRVDIDWASVAPNALKKSFGKALSVLGTVQSACAVRGTLNFIAGASNVLVSIELARFAVHILTAADYQKAGILSSEGLGLLMVWLHSNKGYYGAGGIQELIGNPGTKVTPGILAKVGVGRGHPGVLGSIARFINGIPGINNCKIVNNGFVVAGAFVAGIAAAIFTGGTETIVNASVAITLAALGELAKQIAVPLLIAASAHMLINGLEDGDYAGELLGSGFGVFAAMTASANGLRPATKAQVAALEPIATADEQYATSQMSLYERYLSPSNSESLVSHMAMAMPKNLSSLVTSITSGVQHLFSSIVNLGFLDFLLPSKVKAATLEYNDQCDDPQVLAHGLAAHSNCSLIMANAPDLDETETQSILYTYRLIDEKGYPTSEDPDNGALSFRDFVQRCFTGRPDVLYRTPNPDDEGNEPPEDNTCVESGPTLPGDPGGYGVYDRYAAQYGYTADRDSMTESYLQ